MFVLAYSLSNSFPFLNAMEVLFLLLQFFLLEFVSSEISFTYNGFLQANLSLDGAAYVRPDGILTVTNDSSKLIGHVFYSYPLKLKENKPKSSNESSSIDFSTTFVFSITPRYPDLGGHGLAFVLMSTKEPKDCLPNQFLGLPDNTSTAKFNTNFVAVEFDIVLNPELLDINDNHVGIDVSSLISNASQPAAYYIDDTGTKNQSIILSSGNAIQTWIDYDSQAMLINVTLSPLGLQRPSRPLISFPINLSSIMDDYMYAGFSASTGQLSAAHSVLGWSLRVGGTAQDLDPSELQFLVKPIKRKVVHTKGFFIGITLASLTLIFLVISGAIHVVQQIRNRDENLEDWEKEYGTRRYKYSELYAATRGFRERNVIGTGGFGKVYKGVVPSTGLEVAIKRFAPNSRQGMREFAAEITSMGQLRHRNLVQLHGWCRRHDELLLVYEYIPNGSLDKLLFDNSPQKTESLTWEQRYNVIIGVAKALLYLHEECDQMVVHRDVKPSNVLIDANLEPKLGDFGLSRTYKHGIHPQTTHIVGTLGYLAPELARTGKATTSTDVYGYGALLLELTCRRRPIEPQRNAGELVLIDWVKELHSQGVVVQAVDPSLDEYNPYEVELVLILGLVCTHPQPECRPTMRKVVEVLLGDAILPKLPPDFHHEASGAITRIDYPDICLDDSYPSCGGASSRSTSFSSFDKMITAKQSTRITL